VIKKKIFCFVLLASAAVLPGCSGTSASLKQSDIKAVTGDTQAVKSYTAAVKYSERPKTVLKTPGNTNPLPLIK